MPYDSIGVIVFVIGDHSAPLYNIISYNIYERLLGLGQTPWSERRLKDRAEGRKLSRQGRQKVGGEKVAHTTPSHPIAAYAGEYEHPAYGSLTITLQDSSLQFDFHKIVLPLNHYHYDRFDTPNDEQYGTWSVNFTTDPQGDIHAALMSLDESEAEFTRKPDASLTDPKVLRTYAGKYEFAGSFFDITLKTDNSLYLVSPGQPAYQLIPTRHRQFKTREFADITFEFVVANGVVTSMKQRDPSGEYVFTKSQE
jgi:hypothetical protein